MGRFFAGFVTASVLWAAGGALYVSGAFTGSEEEAPELAASVDAGVDEAEEAPARRRGRRRARRGAAGGGEPVPQGIATTGDDLGADDPRTVDMEAGEEQLAQAEIEQGIDGAFGRIRRCLVLAAGDEPVTGRLVFGLRIASSGAIERVNLRGPAAVTTGEAGECLRSAVQSVRFRAFDGPSMIVHYPITLD